MSDVIEAEALEKSNVFLQINNALRLHHNSKSTMVFPKTFYKIIYCSFVKDKCVPNMFLPETEKKDH